MDIVKKKIGTDLSPLTFMVTHFVMFLCTHMLAIAQYHSFWVSTLFVSYYSIISVWNGANFYMEYFCKKYEKQLEELEKMHQSTTTVKAE